MAELADLISTRSLVLGMVRNDFSLEAGELYDVGLQCGFTNHQLRLCLARLVKEGVFQQTGRGRQAMFRATPKGEREIEPQDLFLRLAWAQSSSKWQGKWYMVGFTIDESRRHERNQLRDHIVKVYSGAPVANGLFVSIHPWDDAVRDVARNLGVEDRLIFVHSSKLEISGVSEPKLLVGHLWDLDRLTARWAEFVGQSSATLEAEPANGNRTSQLASLVAIIAEWWEILKDDPLLPPELLPDDWQSAKARELFAETSARIRALREDAEIPQLFRRFDAVMGELHRGQSIVSSADRNPN